MPPEYSNTLELQSPDQPGLEAFGYSSSSESDEAPNKSNTNNNQNVKKKKKRTTPQKSINKIWRRFASKQPNKALAILPFDPVPLPTTSERPNELLDAGYERARDECSRKVKKIIQECRRVNMRYRDPGFDLDWDLKKRYGNCLNYLGSNNFNLHVPKKTSTANVPKAVKRVHEIFEKPTFMKQVTGADVKQGSLGNCWFIAGLSALANVENGLKRICVEYDTRIGIYGFVFYRDGEWIYSIIDDKLYLTSPNWDSPSLQRELLNQLDWEHPEREYRKTYQTGSKSLFFAQCRDQNETWVPLIEKAYAKAHGDYGSLSGGWFGEGLEDISGGVTTELLISDILDLDGFWENELSKVNQEFLFGCSTGLLEEGYGARNGIEEGHAYVIMDARKLKTGERLVKLRNPWGMIRKGLWEGAWSDGSKEWNREVKEELNHEFGNDSVFWITFEDLIEKYQHIDRTRLFREDEWRCCQRWIGVEVPWKPQWNEKFHFRLTKESPVVLVLQQLDDRYYRGLLGQYKFHLHFRVHEQGKPNSEDYIVRSHGTYFMDRSTAVELPCMEPGSYSVWVSVDAIRCIRWPSVEDVVKRECLNREENEKLAQVGYAYDLAHSKGVAHLEYVAKLRKQSDQKKASSSRMAERRKLWERRHISRDINRKQKKKNEEKRERRRKARQEELMKAEAAAKENAMAEEAKQKKEETEDKPKDVAVQTDRKESGEDRSMQTETIGESSKSLDTTKEQPVGGDSERTGGESKPPDPKSEESAAKKDQKVDVTSSSGSDSSASEQSEREEQRTQPTPPNPPAYDSESDSSDSPVEDWELIYSSDDMSKKPRTAEPPPASKDKETPVESDGESSMPYPWNAVCIAGFRVYSKDEDLQLHIVLEGGELAEGGMGEKGSADIDNAQDNAGGAREEAKDSDKTTDEFEIIDGDAITKKKMVVDGDKKDDENKADADDPGSEADDESEPDKEKKDKIWKKKGNKKGRKDKENEDRKEGPTPDLKPDDKGNVTKSDDSDSSTSPINTPDSTTDPSGECNTQSKRNS